MEPCHLFVYGTLRKAAVRSQHALLQPATFVGVGRIRGKLYDLGNYPGAVFSDDPAKLVWGDVYRLHEPVSTLARLDAYEACSDADPHPHEYRRTSVAVWLETNEAISAMIYLYNRSAETLTQIPSGDYLAFLAQGPDSSDDA